MCVCVARRPFSLRPVVFVCLMKPFLESRGRTPPPPPPVWWGNPSRAAKVDSNLERISSAVSSFPSLHLAPHHQRNAIVSSHPSGPSTRWNGPSSGPTVSAGGRRAAMFFLFFRLTTPTSPLLEFSGIFLQQIIIAFHAGTHTGLFLRCGLFEMISTFSLKWWPLDVNGFHWCFF